MPRGGLSLREVFAKNLRLLRNDRKISQDALADEAGIHRTYVGSVERGERNIAVDNIEKLARALKCDPESFFKGWRR